VLCQTAIVHSRKIGDTVYTFGHEGVLYRSSFVMYDKQTDSLWIHTTGEAVKGPSKGKVLTFLPSTVTTWKTWKTLHPQTTVLGGRPAKGFMGHFGMKEKPETYGLSLGQGPDPKLYPFSVLMKRRVVNDTFDGRDVVIVYDAESRTARAYARGEHTFAWKDGALRDEKGRTWDLLRGLLAGKTPTEAGSKAAGSKAGMERLMPLPATTWLLVRWKGFHPHSAVFKDA